MDEKTREREIKHLELLIKEYPGYAKQYREILQDLKTKNVKQFKLFD